METWGELFWDAWIRFRLWCRSVRRMFWPPRIEAWQVCTVTGVAAIVLTVLSLRGKATPAVDPQQLADEQKSSEVVPNPGQKISKRAGKKAPATPAVEPYEEALPVDGVDSDSQEIALDGGTDSMLAQTDSDSEFVSEDVQPDRKPRPDRRRASRGEKLGLKADAPFPDAEPEAAEISDELVAEKIPAGRLNLDSDTESAKVETGQDFQDSADSVPVPDEMEAAVRLRNARTKSDDAFETPVETPEIAALTPDRQADESVLPELPRQPVDEELVVEPVVDPAPNAVVAKPIPQKKIVPPRAADHYRRPHHEHEEEPGTSAMPIARAKKIDFTPPPPPDKAPVRSDDHYNRFADDEENRSTDDEIRPRQVTVKTISEAKSEEPETEAESAPAEADSHSEKHVPHVHKHEKHKTTDVAEEEAAPELKVSEEPLVETEPVEAEAEAMPNEVAELEAAQPPVLFAPEPEVEIEPVIPTADSHDKPSPQFHGPVLSTESSDHEAHLDEDVLVHAKRKQPIKMKLLDPKPSDPALAARDKQDVPETVTEVPERKPEFHGPVLSTEAVDHEAHLDEDVLVTEKRKRPVTLEVESDSSHSKKSYHGPVLSTESVDHEAHVDEDVLVKEKRKKPITIEVPLSKPVEFHGPVLSTDSVDHEAHEDEDRYSKGKHLVSGGNVLAPKTVKPSSEHQSQQPVSPQPELSQPEMSEEIEVEKPLPGTETQPVDSEFEPSAEPSQIEQPIESTVPAKSVNPAASEEPATLQPTAPRSVPQTTPRAVPYDHGEEKNEEKRNDEEKFEQEPPVQRTYDPDSVITTTVPELTQPRGPARISIPERIPQPEETRTTTPRTREPAVHGEAAPVVPTAPRISRAEAAPRLEMEITGPRKVPVGTQVVLHFKIKNVGTTVATGIMVSDVLPPGLQHRLSADLEYVIPRLAPGETRETNMTVQCTAPGIITNRAALTADGNGTAEASIQLEVTNGTIGGPNTAITRSPVTLAHRGPERWLVDSTGQFLVTVTNTSGQRLRDVTISETFPSETNLIHATVGHKLDAKSRTVTWKISDFAPGASYILETELHSTKSGPQTTAVKVRIGDTDVAVDRWTAVSYPEGALP